MSFWKVAWGEIREPMILLLFSVAAAYAVLGEPRDALVALLITVVLVFVEIFTELRAKKAIAQLRKLTAPTTAAIRDGRQVEVPTESIVPGDIIVVGAGNRAAADARLIWDAGLAVDESALTGESVPVEKDACAELVPETPLGDRVNMVFAGTLAVRGTGKALVVATGMNTELGKIAGMVKAAREPRTPLQKHMRELTGSLLWLALAFSLAIPILGIMIARQPWPQMVLTGLSLAFATIPEEAPILITMVLGLGSLRLARRNAIVKRLRAAETLGSVTVIASDKTGTLTENKLRVSYLWTAGGLRAFSREGSAGESAPESLTEEEVRALLVGLRCHGRAGVVRDISPEALADPTEAALVAAALQARPGEVSPPGLPLAIFPFDSDRKMMSIVYRRDPGVGHQNRQSDEAVVFAKGAPEAILARCARLRLGQEAVPLDEAVRGQIQATAESLAAEGLRVLALAEKPTSLAVGNNIPREETETALTLVGMAALADFPRPEARSSVEAVRKAGIRVVMITGDHPATARAVARKVGIEADKVLTGLDINRAGDEDLAREVRRVSVYARITPEHKLRIVKALRSNGEIVAMTGDGANDAPALKEADIGVAMGRNGTDVAKEAAGIVLADDNFATLVESVREGRGIFSNLQKAVRYYLAAKIALVATMLIPLLLGIQAPFAAVVIIITELFMDLGASVAFVSEGPEKSIMTMPPRRPDRPFLDKSMLVSIFAGGLSLFAAVTAVYLLFWFSPGTHDRAQTAAFATWMVGHVLLAFVLRTNREPLTARAVSANPALVAWSSAAIFLTVLTTAVPPLRPLLRTTGLTARDWALVAGVSAVSVAWIEVLKRVASSSPTRWR